MSLQIFYGNNNQLAYPVGQPIPLFGVTDTMIRYGERWAEANRVTLQGQLSGCSYQSILSAKSQLQQIYSADFQSLQIIQNGSTLYQSDYNRIVDIDFQNSSYFGLLDYTVSLESYPADLFSGYFGVLDPVNEWNFTEQENKLLEVTHKVSARGINTSSGFANAFDNAKNYVLGLTGSSSFINPYFINYCTGAFLCVDTFKESINRFAGTYSVEEKYILDLYNGGAGYIRYAAEYQCDTLKGIASLGINGEIKSCKNAPLSVLRNKYFSFDVYSAAVQSYVDASARLDLNPNYLSSGISEDNYNKKITFNVQFDNDFTPRTYFDYSTDIKVDDSDITTVDIKGTIKSRGDLATRWQNVQFYYNNELNLFYLANQAYTNFEDQINKAAGILYPLNPIQQNYSITKNPFAAEISVATSYNNQDIFPPDFKYLDYTLNFKPAIYQIASMPLVAIGSGVNNFNQDYYTVNLGYLNRASLELKGKFVGSCTGNQLSTTTAIKNLANYYILNYGNQNRIFLDKNSINSSNQFQGLDFDVDFSWSFDASQSANSAPFNSVNTLYIGSIPVAPPPTFNILITENGNNLTDENGNQIISE